MKQKLTKEEAVAKAEKKYLKPISIIQIVFILTFISSPFLWIWFGWSIAWRVGLTGLIGVLIFGIIMAEITKAIQKLERTELKKEQKNL